MKNNLSEDQTGFYGAKEYSIDLNDFLVEQYIQEIYEGFNFEPFKKVIKDLGKDLVSNFKFIGTFGAAITLFYPIVEIFLKTSNFSVEVNTTNIVLATIAAISMLIDRNQNKIKWVLSKLKDRKWQEIIDKLVNAFKNLKDLFSLIVVETGKIIRNFSDMLAYTFMLVPFMKAVFKFIQTNGVGLNDISDIAIGFGVGTAIISGKHLIDWIVKEMTRKNKNLRKIEKTIPHRAFKENILNERVKTDTIAVFDIDDTLLFSNSKIKYKEPGKNWQDVGTEEFAIIRTKLHPKTQYDFSEFQIYDRILYSIETSKPNIEVLKVMDKAIRNGYKIGLLTARGSQDAIWKGLNTFLLYRNERDELVPLPKSQFMKKYVFAVGDAKVQKAFKSQVSGGSASPSEIKAFVLQKIFGDTMGFQKIIFFDDDPDNVKKVKALNDPRIEVVKV